MAAAVAQHVWRHENLAQCPATFRHAVLILRSKQKFSPLGHAGDGGGDVAPKVDGEALAARDGVHQLRPAWQRHPQVLAVAHHIPQRCPCRLQDIDVEV